MHINVDLLFITGNFTFLLIKRSFSKSSIFFCVSDQITQKQQNLKLQFEAIEWSIVTMAAELILGKKKKKKITHFLLKWADSLNNSIIFFYKKLPLKKGFKLELIRN